MLLRMLIGCCCFSSPRVGAVQNIGLLDRFLEIELTENAKGILGLHGLSLFMTQIVSNVPYNVLMIPIMEVVDSEKLWLCLASSSTLAGNATIIGAMANLIVIEGAEKENIKISFWEFFKVGIIVTLTSFVISILYFLI